MEPLQDRTLIEGLSGKVGETVYEWRGGRQVTRPYQIPHDPQTDAQLQIRDNMRAANEAYRSLTDAEFKAWKKYAAQEVRHKKYTAQTYHPTTFCAFNQLALKLLQIDPETELPTLPPTTPFLGDTITLTVRGGAGTLFWTASGGNGADVVTELLVQKLKRGQRKAYEGKYRTLGFAFFESPELTDIFFIASGTYATAYRFVNSLTGQASPLVPLHIVSVS